jgi:hypothetical protein
MLKRESVRAPNDAESADENGDVVAERARKQPKLTDPQTQNSDIDTTDATLDLKGNHRFGYDLGWADDFTWDSACDAEWSSATYPGFLGISPVLAGSQSGIVDEKLPVKGSSAALVYYGMVIPVYLPVAYWCWHS